MNKQTVVFFFLFKYHKFASNTHREADVSMESDGKDQDSVALRQ